MNTSWASLSRLFDVAQLLQLDAPARLCQLCAVNEISVYAREVPPHPDTFHHARHACVSISGFSGKIPGDLRAAQRPHFSCFFVDICHGLYETLLRTSFMCAHIP